MIKYCRAWTLPALKYWKATTEKIPAKESKKILTIILQVPACLLISKFWLDDIVGELMLDHLMERRSDLSVDDQLFNTGPRKGKVS